MVEALSDKELFQKLSRIGKTRKWNHVKGNKRNKGIKRGQRSNQLGELFASLEISEHSPFPKTISLMKASTNEKNKGINMIDTIMERFYISQFEIEKWRKQMKEKEEKDFDEMNFIAQENELRDEKVIWTRDEKGNIVSPFRSKIKLD